MIGMRESFNVCFEQLKAPSLVLVLPFKAWIISFFETDNLLQTGAVYDGSRASGCTVDVVAVFLLFGGAGEMTFLGVAEEEDDDMVIV